MPIVNLNLNFHFKPVDLFGLHIMNQNYEIPRNSFEIAVELMRNSRSIIIGQVYDTFHDKITTQLTLIVS